jgi:hypothetical protein
MLHVPVEAPNSGCYTEEYKLRIFDHQELTNIKRLMAYENYNPAIPRRQSPTSLVR